jgi:hypothetical protein
MLIERPYAASLLWLLAALASGAAGCAPKASSTPLGLGPLALAEQAAAVEKKPRAAKPPSVAAATASAAKTPSTSSSDAAEEKSSADEEEAATTEKSSSEPKSGGKPGPAFAGLFAGKDVAIFRIAGMPERQELDDKAQIRIESESATQLRIVLINSENGSDLCELSAEIQGNSALLDAGQPCFTSEGEGAIHAELTSGKVVLSGDKLSMDAEGTLSVALAEEELDGDLSYSFKGKRQ